MPRLPRRAACRLIVANGSGGVQPHQSLGYRPSVPETVAPGLQTLDITKRLTSCIPDTYMFSVNQYKKTYHQPVAKYLLRRINMTDEEIAAQALAVHARISLVRKILLEDYEIESADLNNRLPETDWTEKYTVALRMVNKLKQGCPDPELLVHKIQNYL